MSQNLEIIYDANQYDAAEEMPLCPFAQTGTECVVTGAFLSEVECLPRGLETDDKPMWTHHAHKDRDCGGCKHHIEVEGLSIGAKSTGAIRLKFVELEPVD